MAKKRKKSQRAASKNRTAAKKPGPSQKTRKKASSIRKKTARASVVRGSRGAESALISDLRHFIRTEGPKFLKDPNITSLGIGYKIENGKRTDDLSVQFTVRTKVEDSGSALENLNTEKIPETLEIAGKKIPTDVIQRDYQPAFRIRALEELDPRKLRHDPIMPGISVSHPLGTAGTLGLIVFDRDTGDPCMLSNWHVLHGPEGNINDEIVQPGPFDDNQTENNGAGQLIRSHLGHAGDCALARIEDRDFVQAIHDLDVAPSQIGQVELGDRVIKSGRTTSVTRGLVRRVDVLARIDYGGDVHEQDIGGFEIGPEDGAPADYEVSMGGDSGSAWLIADENGNATDVFAGLHFAGESGDNPDEHALACYAHSVFKKMNVVFTPSEITDEPEAVSGYNPSFLSHIVRTPALTGAILKDAFQLNGDHLINYTHFSISQSKSRRLPRFVAWNIDGKRIKSVSRSGLDFKLDPRVDAAFQAGDELYFDNKLDRGHIARRADLCWGSMTEAKRANRDSFFFTNIAPQHEAFNQSGKRGLWGRLENAVLEEVDVLDLRVSVLAGPVFGPTDEEYRGIMIPRSYWKLLAYHDVDEDRFEVRAYILTQRDLLHDIEALDLDPFRLYQVSLSKLFEETGLDFAQLSEFDTHDPEAGPEAITSDHVREITSEADVLRDKRSGSRVERTAVVVRERASSYGTLSTPRLSPRLIAQRRLTAMAKR